MESSASDHSNQPSSQEPSGRWSQLAAYVLGGLPAQEEAEMERWIAAEPERKARVEALRAGHVRQAETDAIDVEQALGQVLTRFQIGVPDKHASPIARFPARPLAGWKLRSAGGRVWATMLGAAAVCAAITTIVIQQRQPLHVISPIYQTAIAQQATVTLADGTRVILAPESKLTVENAFGHRTRTVTLSGEAFFTVRSATRAPFIVRTGDVTTRVLGTEFGVRAYPADSVVRVTVVSGKVESGGEQQSITLTAGTVSELTDSTVVSSKVNGMDAYIGWTRGQLVFENVPAAAMLATVGRWYGYTFRVTDSTLAARRFSAVLALDARDETMMLLQSLLNVNMRITGETVIVHPRAARRDTPPPRRVNHDVFSPSAEVGK